MNTETVNYWPIVVVIEDVHVPAWAETVIEQARDFQMDTIAVGVELAGYNALVDAFSRCN